MMMIKIDRIIYARYNFGLWLAVGVQGREIKLSGGCQKLSLLRKGLIHCKDDLSEIVKPGGDRPNLYYWPELAVIHVRINRMVNRHEIDAAEITPNLLNTMMANVAERIKQ
jgi:hypothetical protein